jgi:hypothetical protein
VKVTLLPSGTKRGPLPPGKGRPRGPPLILQEHVGAGLDRQIAEHVGGAVAVEVADVTAAALLSRPALVQLPVFTKAEPFDRYISAPETPTW